MREESNVNHSAEKEDIFSNIYSRYVNTLYDYGRSLNFPHDECLDAIHDIFVKLYSKNLILEDSTLKYYLLRSLKNRLIDMYRRDHKNTPLDGSEIPFSLQITVLDTIIDQEEKEKMKLRVQSLLNVLTDRQREAVYLRYLHELEYDEIGTLLDMTPESARKLIYRSMKKMRESIPGDSIRFIVSTLLIMKKILSHTYIQ